MNPFTGPLEGFLSSQTMYIPDQLQREMSSAITQQLAGLEPGNWMEENPAESACRPPVPPLALRRVRGSPKSRRSRRGGVSPSFCSTLRTSIWGRPLRLSAAGRAWRHRTLPGWRPC